MIVLIPIFLLCPIDGNLDFLYENILVQNTHRLLLLKKKLEYRLRRSWITNYFSFYSFFVHKKINKKYQYKTASAPIM